MGMRASPSFAACTATSLLLSLVTVAYDSQSREQGQQRSAASFRRAPTGLVHRQKK
jgi:hypothetical protein